MTLLAFAAERPPLSIDISGPHGAAAVEWWDGRSDRLTDAQPFHRARSAYYANSVKSARSIFSCNFVGTEDHADLTCDCMSSSAFCSFRHSLRSL